MFKDLFSSKDKVVVIQAVILVMLHTCHAQAEDPRPDYVAEIDYVVDPSNSDVSDYKTPLHSQGRSVNSEKDVQRGDSLSIKHTNNAKRLHLKRHKDTAHLQRERGEKRKMLNLKKMIDGDKLHDMFETGIHRRPFPRHRTKNHYHDLDYIEANGNYFRDKLRTYNSRSSAPSFNREIERLGFKNNSSKTVLDPVYFPEKEVKSLLQPIKNITMIIDKHNQMNQPFKANNEEEHRKMRSKENSIKTIHGKEGNENMNNENNLVFHRQGSNNIKKTDELEDKRYNEVTFETSGKMFDKNRANHVDNKDYRNTNHRIKPGNRAKHNNLLKNTNTFHRISVEENNNVKLPINHSLMEREHNRYQLSNDKDFYSNLSLITQSVLNADEKKYLGLKEGNGSRVEYNRYVERVVTEPAISVKDEQTKTLTVTNKVNPMEKDLLYQIPQKENKKQHNGFRLEAKRYEKENMESNMKHYDSKKENLKQQTEITDARNNLKYMSYNHSNSDSSEAHSKEQPKRKHKSGNNKKQHLIRDSEDMAEEETYLYDFANRYNDDEYELLDAPLEERESSRSVRDIKQSRSLTNTAPYKKNGKKSFFNKFINEEDNIIHKTNLHDSLPKRSNFKGGQRKNGEIVESGSRFFDKPVNGDSDEGEADEMYVSEDSNKLFDKRAHELKYNNDENIPTDSCVEYKANILDSSTHSTPETSFTTKEKTEISSTAKHIKTKTTIKVENSSQARSKNNSEKLNQGNSIYDRYLCGDLVDNYVNAVLSKVQRSRKIAKELGFSNETDETCDRCLEMKSFKIPTLKAMKNSLEQCGRYNGLRQNTSRCYNVPQAMEQFLDVLLYYEQEYKSTIHEKIKDDSSFIFTGDYGEPFSKSGDNIMGIHDKYDVESDSLSRDSYEKQHLRDEIEEKGYKTSKNENLLKSKKRNLNRNPKNNLKKSMGIAKGRENEEDETIQNPRKSKTRKESSDESLGHSFPADENLKGNDLMDVFDSHDSLPSHRTKYSANKDSEVESYNDRFELNSGSQHEIINYKPPIVEKTDSRSPLISGSNLRQHKESEYNRFNEISRQSRPKSDYSGLDNRYETFRQEFKTPDSDRSNINLNRYLSPKQTNQREADHFFVYHPDDDKNSQKWVNNGPRQSISEGSRDNVWESDEYQFLPKQGIRQFEDSPRQFKRKRDKKFIDDSLKMVKRETDSPYEEESVFFEIPDIEYDLYK